MAGAHHWQILIGAAAAMIVATAAPAQPDNNTIQVAARVATFLQPALSGHVVAAIVYQPGDAASENEARQIERSMGSGVVVGSLRLAPRRVAAGGDLAGARVAFVTRGVDYREVARAATARSILSFGSDPACMKAGFCTVTITSTPTVRITVSKAALKASNLRFNAGFLMLIREI